MKAPQIFITFLFSLILAAQKNDQIIRYEYSLTIHTEIEKNIEMVLDVYNDTTYFTEKKFIEFQQDIDRAYTEKDTKLRFEILKNATKKHEKPDYFIIKSNAKDNITFEKFKNQKFYISESRNALKWDIDENPFIWNGFSVKKATTFCDGRFWTVYFTQDISLNTGPYKFNNLPGFVVKAWDKTNQFVFEYETREKLLKQPLYIYKPETYSEITLHEKKVLKEVFYPDIANTKNDKSRATGIKIENIENSIDLSFVEEI